MTCSGCDETAENFISTAAGNICLPCFQNQDRPTGDKRDRTLAGSRQEVSNQLPVTFQHISTPGRITAIFIRPLLLKWTHQYKPTAP